jgi:hypothetical protein
LRNQHRLQFFNGRKNAQADNMMEHQQQEQGGGIDPKVLKSAMKAFKKRLKLTALDDDSRLGRGPLSGGSRGVCAIKPPSRFPQEVWDELCRQGRLRDSGHGLYELVKVP